jgi:hypothetical protein
MDLLRTNVKSRQIGKKIIFYSSCLEEHPELLRKFEGYTKLGTCLEDKHMNKVAWKIFNILKEKKPKKVVVLTVDGSPHCVQLHHAIRDLRKGFSLEVRHCVVYQGDIYEVTEKAIERARHLKEIQDSLAYS